MNLVKVAGYKINIQKSVVFLYINNATAENNQEKCPITIALKTIKYSGMNLTKEIKELYNKKIQDSDGKN